MPKDVVSRYEYMKSKEGPRGSEEMYESGALEDEKILTKSDTPNRSNYYKYKNPADAKEAYESLQAENEMRIGMKSGGLWDNIHAKRKRIESGSGERMRKPGSEGAPTAKDLRVSQSKKEGGRLNLANCKVSTAKTTSKKVNY
jgi:hypothetical protein